MTDEELRPLVLEAIKTAKGVDQYSSVQEFLRRKFSDENLGPFGPTEHVQINRILWDLSVERIISWGAETDSEARWPFFHVTPFGHKYLEEMAPHFLDPDGYLQYLRALVLAVDPIVLQYTQESARAFRAQLWFASAVMLGAASERTVLLLLEAIRDKTPNSEKAKLTKLLEQPRIGEIFKVVQACVAAEIKAGSLPYSVHQGCTEHLLSLSEMIRVHRNEAVHPAAAKVDRQKAFIALQTFPEALRIIEGVRKWFAP
ncbi:MAG TPA: hypothetical protein ACFYD7_10405 [Candidatus Wujingus californicus]|uniref:hypothetical protein n=1 Tax=Candidatus Wujingus californicus TaxID=3367618 RepID=UPI001E11E01E|nr:hypothetical protein [Planctomycetota bacterium]MDO8132022.1 hypothetical protein [Candidatus Brocadiales bacterium]